MDEMQKYLFDLNGYLVIEEVLDAAGLAVLNGIIDGLEIPRRFPPGLLCGRPAHPPRVSRLGTAVRRPPRPPRRHAGAALPAGRLLPARQALQHRHEPRAADGQAAFRLRRLVAAGRFGSRRVLLLPPERDPQRLRRRLLEPHRLGTRNAAVSAAFPAATRATTGCRGRSPRRGRTPPTSSSPRRRRDPSPCSPRPSPTAPRPGAAPTSAAPCCSSTACRRWHGEADASAPPRAAS